MGQYSRFIVYSFLCLSQDSRVLLLPGGRIVNQLTLFLLKKTPNSTCQLPIRDNKSNFQERELLYTKKFEACQKDHKEFLVKSNKSTLRGQEGQVKRNVTSDKFRVVSNESQIVKDSCLRQSQIDVKDTSMRSPPSLPHHPGLPIQILAWEGGACPPPHSVGEQRGRGKGLMEGGSKPLINELYLG